MDKRALNTYLLLTLLIPMGLGAQWSSMNTGIDKNFSLRSISFPTHEIGYLTSANNPDEEVSNLYKTIDGGLSWMLIESNIETTDNYKGFITFIDEKTGFLEGGQFCTKDGGVTWTATLSTENSSIFFTDKSDIYCMDRSESNPAEGLMLKSSDFGHTWTTLSPINGTLAHFELIDDDIIYGFSSRDIEISSDQGSNWKRLEDSALPGGFPVSTSDFITAEHGIVVFIYHGVSRMTFDRGRTWEKTNYPGVIRDVEHNSRGFYAVGYEINSAGGIFYSPDGTDWINMNPGGNEQMNELLLLDDNSAWAVGDYGTVLKNENLTLSTSLESTKADKVKIYPNPTNDSLNIEIDSSKDINKIQLLTADGKLITDCLAAITKLDVSTLKVGIYYLRIELTDGQQTTQKLVVN